MASYARYQGFVQDETGAVVPGAHIEVRSEVPGLPLAALKADRTGGSALTNPFDADADGFFAFHVTGGAYQVRAYLGPSGAPTFERILNYVAIGLNAESDSASSLTQREVTAAGAVTVSADDADIIVINKTVGAATTVNLPSAASRTKPVKIVDGKGDAGANNITIVPVSGQKVFGTVDFTPTIDGNGGQLTLTPKADGSGWL
jgi:hypothetical protein